MAVPSSRLLVALLQRRAIDDSLCVVVMPHAPRFAPQNCASGWELMPSFELTDIELTSLGSSLKPQPCTAQAGRKATSWVVWGRAPIVLSTRGDCFCQGPRLRCGLVLSHSWISLHYDTEESGQRRPVIDSLMISQPFWNFCATNCVIPKKFKHWLPETILQP